jgi:hypothetical protein
MTETPLSQSTLPPGETDPIKLYVAVGMAIHAWEGMEEALARLYAAFCNLPEDPQAMSVYGSENRRFIDRINAIRESSDAYFIRFPNQEHEGELDAIVQTAVDLSIQRHRIAHGHITQWGAFNIPDGLKRGDQFEMVAVFHYRWGAPFYSHTNLRTNPVGVDAAWINAIRAEFEALWNRAAALLNALSERLE